MTLNCTLAVIQTTRFCGNHHHCCIWLQRLENVPLCMSCTINIRPLQSELQPGCQSHIFVKGLSFRALFWQQFLKLLPAPKRQPVLSGLNVDEKKTSTILFPAIRMRSISRGIQAFDTLSRAVTTRAGMSLILHRMFLVCGSACRKPTQACKLSGAPCCHLAWRTHLKGLKPCSHCAMSGSKAAALVQRGVGLLGQVVYLNGLHLFEIYTNCKHHAIKSKSCLLFLRFSWTPSANREAQSTEMTVNMCWHFVVIISIYTELSLHKAAVFPGGAYLSSRTQTHAQYWSYTIICRHTGSFLPCMMLWQLWCHLKLAPMVIYNIWV